MHGYPTIIIQFILSHLTLVKKYCIFQCAAKEVFKVTQRDQIVGHNVADSPEQCAAEQTILL